MTAEHLANLDAFIAIHPEPKPSRPETIRRLIEAGLSAHATPKTPPSRRKV
jgi:hypothetical protein